MKLVCFVVALYSCVLLTPAASAALTCASKIASGETKRVAVLPGSFDPFHLGHLEMVETLLRNRIVDCVHLLVNLYGPKNYSLSMKERMDIIRLSTQHLGQSVQVLPEPLEGRDHHTGELESRADHKVFRVVGEDGWSAMPTSLKDDEGISWLIFPRSEQRAIIPESENRTFISNAIYRDLRLSSSAIRSEMDPPSTASMHSRAIVHLRKIGYFSHPMSRKTFEKTLGVISRVLGRSLTGSTYNPRQTLNALVEETVRRNVEDVRLGSSIARQIQASFEANKCESLLGKLTLTPIFDVRSAGERL